MCDKSWRVETKHPVPWMISRHLLSSSFSNISLADERVAVCQTPLVKDLYRTRVMHFPTRVMGTPFPLRTCHGIVSTNACLTTLRKARRLGIGILPLTKAGFEVCLSLCTSTIPAFSFTEQQGRFAHKLCLELAMIASNVSVDRAGRTELQNVRDV